MRPKPLVPVLNWKHPLARGLVGAWVFSERGGTTARELVGRNNGTLTNFTLGSAWINDRYGPAVVFDGSNDRVAVPKSDRLSLAGRPATLECILRMTATGARIVLGFYDQVTNAGYALGVSVVTSGKLGYWGGQGSGAWKESAVSVNDDLWKHVIVTVRNTEVSFYVNGVFDVSRTGQQPVGTSVEQDNIGSSSFPHLFFPGRLAGARIWRRALNAAEIGRLYADPWGMYLARDRVIRKSAAVGSVPIYHLVSGGSL